MSEATWTPLPFDGPEGVEYKEIIEAIALAAWKSYCGVPEAREEWMDDDDWSDSQAPIRQWHDRPSSCTHIGADGFRRIAGDVAKALRAMDIGI